MVHVRWYIVNILLYVHFSLLVTTTVKSYNVANKEIAV